MSLPRTLLLTTLAMIAFAGNSLLCRLAFTRSAIDPASFTAVRLISGAFVLFVLVGLRQRAAYGAGNWLSAFALFAYAAGFSFAYVTLPVASGALLLFGAVQVTMIAVGLWNGERLRAWQWLGLVIASAGLVGLLLPGISAPPLLGSLLMLGAGLAWGVYSLRGRGAGDPTRITAGNFLRAVPMAMIPLVVLYPTLRIDRAGLCYAIASGALASGVGYAIWYSALPGLRATQAASVQLSVPVIAALASVVFLAEPVGLRLTLASVAILGGIALVIRDKTGRVERTSHGARNR